MAVTYTLNLGLSQAAKGDLVGQWITIWNQDNQRMEDRLTTTYAGDPNGNVAGDFIGQRCWDSVNKLQYICTTTGIASVAVWEIYGAPEDLSIFLQKDQNLADLDDIPTARSNLEVPTLAEVYPVGSVYLEVTGVNPNTTFGFGTWVQRAQGLFLAGVGTGTDVNAVQKSISQGNNNGTYETVLVEDNLPEHAHSLDNGAGDDITATGPGGGSGFGGAGDGSNVITTGTVGASAAFEHYPPAFGLYIWERTA